MSLGGVTASQSQAFQGLLLALLLAILLVYLVMVAFFRSIIQPLILLVSIPFAATGSILLLLATHTTLGVPALIGLLMLVGIVVTNAIVLLDLVNQYPGKRSGCQNVCNRRWPQTPASYSDDSYCLPFSPCYLWRWA